MRELEIFNANCINKGEIVHSHEIICNNRNIGGKAVIWVKGHLVTALTLMLALSPWKGQPHKVPRAS